MKRKAFCIFHYDPEILVAPLFFMSTPHTLLNFWTLLELSNGTRWGNKFFLILLWGPNSSPPMTSNFFSLYLIKPRKFNSIVQSHIRQLSQLKQKTQEGRNASVLFHEHLKDLITVENTKSYQNQGLQNWLSEGHSLAEYSFHKLSQGTE